MLSYAQSAENAFLRPKRKKTRTVVLAYPLAKGELLFILQLLSSLMGFRAIIVFTIIYTLT